MYIYNYFCVRIRTTGHLGYIFRLSKPLQPLAETFTQPLAMGLGRFSQPTDQVMVPQTKTSRNLQCVAWNWFDVRFT